MSVTLTGFVAWPKAQENCSTVYADVNWVLQDASHPNAVSPRVMHMDECRSCLGYVIQSSNGPIAWGCTKEGHTSRSSCESEIKATDEAVKYMQFLLHVMSDMGLPECQLPTPLWNDKYGAVTWSQSVFHKLMRHFNIRNSAVREFIQFKEISIGHIEGKINPYDLLTKEQRDPKKFCDLRRSMLTPPPQQIRLRAARAA